MKGVSIPKDLATHSSLAIGNEPIILTPLDDAWLKPDECFVVSDISFEQLADSEDWRQNASLPELITGLRNPSLGLASEVRVAIHARIVQPFLDVTL